MSQFPAEDEPDGNRWFPHHGLWAVPLYMLGWYLWHPGGSPFWGATLTGVATALLVDDWLSHALGYWTPADWAFHRLLEWPPFAALWFRVMGWYHVRR